MAKISEIVSQATPTYQPDNLNQFGRDINNIIHFCIFVISKGKNLDNDSVRRIKKKLRREAMKC